MRRVSYECDGCGERVELPPLVLQVVAGGSGWLHFCADGCASSYFAARATAAGVEAPKRGRR